MFVVGSYSYMGCLKTQVDKGPIIANWVAQLEVNFTSVAQLAICICKFHFLIGSMDELRMEKLMNKNC